MEAGQTEYSTTTTLDERKVGGASDEHEGRRKERGKEVWMDGWMDLECGLGWCTVARGGETRQGNQNQLDARERKSKDQSMADAEVTINGDKDKMGGWDIREKGEGRERWWRSDE